MMLTLALLLAAHGVIHLLGFARAFGVVVDIRCDGEVAGPVDNPLLDRPSGVVGPARRVDVEDDTRIAGLPRLVDLLVDKLRHLAVHEAVDIHHRHLVRSRERAQRQNSGDEQDQGDQTHAGEPAAATLSDRRVLGVGRGRQRWSVDDGWHDYASPEFSA